MFGKNIVVKPVWTEPVPGHSSIDKAAYDARVKGETLSIKNIFPTIQGEGPLAGTPSIFIRLAGCNLRCHFCDTDFENGHPRDVPEIMAAVEVMREQYPEIDLVVLTGGEPMRQQILPLLHALDEAGFTSQIETAGTVWPPIVKIPGILAGRPGHVTLESLLESGAVRLVCSPKTPQLHTNIIEYCEDFKYIIREGECDERGLPNKSTQIEGAGARIWGPDRDNAFHKVWLQPCFEYQQRVNNTPNIDLPDIARIAANNAECVKQAMKHGYRISLQQHKILDIE